ncbi:MAG: hypothetical protein Q4Q06_07465, partial [Bacteroidota bacterium]|nr:hypothetical protein [Bacteroidota bacterium]
KINLLLTKYRKETFDKLFQIGKIEYKINYSLKEQIVLTNPITDIPKSLYIAEDNINGFERTVIDAIANLEDVKWWHRNLERGRGFYINGFINHYPDFIVRMKSGKILLIETKGGNLDNTDSENKLYLGTKWANMLGNDYKYFMIFQNNTPQGAYNFNDAISIIKQL